MDRLWDENPSKSQVIGCCDRDENNEYLYIAGHKSIFDIMYYRHHVLSTSCIINIMYYQHHVLSTSCTINIMYYQQVYTTGKTGSWGHRESKQQQQRSFMWGITGEQEWSPELTTGMCVHTLFLQVEW